MYGKFTAVKSVSLAFSAHRVHALIGPSGCGKSTFLRTLNRMHELVGGRLDHRAGAARRRGHLRPAGERHAAPAPHRHGLPAPHAVPDHVHLRQRGGRTPGARPACRGAELDDIVERSLRQAALWDEVKDRLHASAMALSGGQQQRLCIARTVAPAPDVILLDEPTASLDPQGTQRIEELVFELKQHVHHRHRDPQHAAGGAGVGHHDVLLSGHHGRDRRHAADLHRAAERADRSVHHRAIRMSAIMRPKPAFVPTPRATLAPRPPAPQPAERGAPAVDVRGFSFCYGAAQVLRDLELPHRRKAVTAIIGPVGLRQVHVPAVDQPPQRPHHGHAAPGRHPGRGPVRLRPGHRPRGAAAAGGHGVPAAQPVPQVDLRQRRLRPALNGWSPGATCPTWSSAASGRRRSGTRSRTGWTSRRPASPADSSSGSASRARSATSPRCC